MTSLVGSLDTTVKDFCFSRKLQKDELEQQLASSFQDDNHNLNSPAPLVSNYTAGMGAAFGAANTGGGFGGGAATTSSTPWTNTSPPPNTNPTPWMGNSAPVATGGGNTNGGLSPLHAEMLAFEQSQEGQNASAMVQQQAIAPEPSGGMTDEQMALKLANEQLVEEQRRLLQMAQYQTKGTGDFTEDYSSQVEEMKSILGDGRKKKDLLVYLEGAGGNVEVAINHLMEDERNGKVKKGGGGGGGGRKGWRSRAGAGDKEKKVEKKSKGQGPLW